MTQSSNAIPVSDVRLKHFSIDGDRASIDESASMATEIITLRAKRSTRHGRGPLPGLATPIKAEPATGWVPVPRALLDHCGKMTGYFIERPPTPDHAFVNVCNGDLRILANMIDTMPLPPASPTPPVENVGEVTDAWRTMDTAPLDGKHCILAVPEPGGFVYNVQGAYQGGQWNAVHRDNVKPLYWMPNFRLPEGWEVATKSPLSTLTMKGEKS